MSKDFKQNVITLIIGGLVSAGLIFAVIERNKRIACIVKHGIEQCR